MGSCFGQPQSSDSEDKIDFKGGNVQVITSKESWDEKMSEADKSGKIVCTMFLIMFFMVVANFSATWCGPCRQITPLYVELSEKHPQLDYVTIDVDELIELSSSWDIRATPTFFFLRNGQQISKIVGANRPELQKKITEYAESAQNST